MDAFSAAVQVTSLAAAVIPLVLFITTSSGALYRKARFGSIWGTFLYLGRLIDTDRLQRRHWDINSWTDEEVLNWKNSHLASCNAISVAAAIFASVSLTALQLPHMDTIHWSSRACCVSSLILGVASVTTATAQHQTVGMLNSPLNVRMWLSRGKPTPYLRSLSLSKLLGPDWRRPKVAPETEFSAAMLQNLWDTLNEKRTEKYPNLEAFRVLPLESSISALKAVTLPRHLLDLSVLLFLVGIGLYELFLWTSRTGPLSIDYRNIFIIFIITLGVYAIYHLALILARSLDEDKRNAEFGTSSLGGFSKPGKLNQLEQELASIQDRRITVEKLDRELQLLLNRVRSTVEKSSRQEDGMVHDDSYAKMKAFNEEFNALQSQRARLVQRDSFRATRSANVGPAPRADATEPAAGAGATV